MRQPPRRSGFTLVELIVALVVIATGILGLVSTAAFLARQTGEGAAREHAVALAEARFERVAATGCAAATGGSATSGFVEEAWTVRRVGRTLVVSDTLRYRSARQRRSLAFERVLLCDD